MNLKLHKSELKRQSVINITGSKSESNRLLLLQALFPELEIENLSNSEDSQLMQKALLATDNVVDIHHAGTAMRFLTAYFSIQHGKEVLLTGSSRMQERPIQVLVEALQVLGADITYEKNNGFPPIRIKGKSLTMDKVTLKANVSSQYISALLLIAPKLKNGLELSLEGKITSVPYINMTLSLLREIGIGGTFEDHTITVKPLRQAPMPKTFTVESDWSSASYFYSFVALSALGTQVTLSSYKENSLQGDALLKDIYTNFGITTVFSGNTIILKKTHEHAKTIALELSNAPDIAQTIAVTCLALDVKCHLTGLHTLKIKETDRLIALKTEIEKFGTKVTITEDSLSISNSNPLNEIISVETYSDHRMAMAFAPLALKTALVINDAQVVSKSYPDFWSDLKKIGLSYD